MDDLDWSKVLNDYEAAVRQCEALAQALADALVHRRDLLTTLQRQEDEAREKLRLARTRVADFLGELRRQAERLHDSAGRKKAPAMAGARG